MLISAPKNQHVRMRNPAKMLTKGHFYENKDNPFKMCPFHAVVTVRIGLKTPLEWEYLFQRIICPCWLASGGWHSAQLFSFHFLTKQAR